MPGGTASKHRENMQHHADVVLARDLNLGQSLDRPRFKLSISHINSGTYYEVWEETRLPGGISCAQGEHATPSRRRPGRDLNLGPQCCKAEILNTVLVDNTRLHIQYAKL